GVQEDPQSDGLDHDRAARLDVGAALGPSGPGARTPSGEGHPLTQLGPAPARRDADRSAADHPFLALVESRSGPVVGCDVLQIAGDRVRSQHAVWPGVTEAHLAVVGVEAAFV